MFVLYYPEGVHAHGNECRVEEGFVRAATQCDVIVANTAECVVLEVAAKTGWDLPTAFSRTLFHPCATFDRPGLVPVSYASAVARGATFADKAGVLFAAAEANGWKTQSIASAVEFTRGAEFLLAMFRGNSWDATAAVWVFGDRNLRLPNLNAALERLAGRPEEVAPPGRRGRKAGSLKRATEEFIPFDIETDEDDIILLECVGKELTWINSHSGEEEQAVVPMDKTDEKGKKITNNHLSLATTKEGRRVLTFVAVGEGFRSVALDALVAVR